MSVTIRELPGREIVEALQQFEWRFQTLQSDYQELQEVRNPSPDDSAVQHQYANRNHIHEAERRLHHYLSGYYTFRCLTTTLAESAPDPECEGRIKHRRNQFIDERNSRAVFGMRHYVQHHNILPVLVKMSSLSDGFPKYAINKMELKMGDHDYQVPSMVADEDDYETGFDYYYEFVEDICIYPFEVIAENWGEVESLRDDVYGLVRTHLSEELEEYLEQLQTLMEHRQIIRERHDEIDDLIEEMGDITPGLREILTPELHDNLIEEDDSDS